ncbi:CDP-diacylglycerol--glycerol-3-phosphate 3-phosphatidyltransferase [Pediococcus pentosaceus]|uniref:CDP-diacylglycerol--glycerol-3-phosphate 3-phosphatidyltransferase n=1 Tax=Pediococcus pentosaceus TaxID=1255 RepID=UPI003594676C
MNLPNKLTIFRIILIPIFIILTVMPEVGGSVVWLGTSIAVTKIWGALVFAIASITDFLDGQIARRQHLVTNFGKFADPIADKMLVMTAFIVLVEMKMVPAWIAAIIVCRELAISGLRLIIVENDGEVLAAEMPGKIKTFSQMFAIIFLLLNNIFSSFLHFGLGIVLLYVCLFFTVYSGIDYFYKNRAIFSDSF